MPIQTPSELEAFFYLLPGFFGVYFYVKSIRKNKKELMRQFFKDPLTNLDNRLAMIKKINETKPYALILLNIDSFRELNDLYGHHTGDKVLRQVSDRLLSFVRNDISQTTAEIKLFKLHADEFGILFQNRLDRGKLEIFSEILLQRISSSPFSVDGHEIAVNATVGISCLDENGNGEGGKQFMTYSNIALREAKKHKKPFLFYDKSMQIEHKYEQNLIWINKLKTAIENDQITPFYQPIINNKNGKIEKYECLVRLIEENGNIVSPYLFLDVAKKSRLYHKITKTIIQKALERFKHVECGVSINISVLDVCDQAMSEYILEELGRSGIGEKVTFEILESEGIDNYEEVYAFIQKVKAYGCKISIDDFGAGYSNFEHILKLKPDFIKIDGSLIKNIDIDHNARIITKAIVGFANELGAMTVAEFVHSKDVFDTVAMLNINYSQGYYIAEPQLNLK